MWRSGGAMAATCGKRVWRQWQKLASTTAAMSEERLQVPVIDMSLPPTELGLAVHETCTTSGFFHIVNHGVSSDLRARVLEESSNFFNLSLDEKETLSVGHSNSYRGYQRVGVNVTKNKLDGHEALDIVSESKRADRQRPDGLTNYGFNQWPDPERIPGLRPMLEQEYIPQLTEVGHRLLSAASDGLGLGTEFFRPYFEDPYWSMRLIHYPAAAASDNQNYEYGIGEHTDYGVFTMIMCDEVKNTLQIRPKGTEDWVTVDPIEGGFLCNIGDMLARWTNNIYVSTPHRVFQPKNETRLSVPFFFDPSYDAIIRPIPSLVERSGRPACFEPIMYGDHLLAKTSNNFLL